MPAQKVAICDSSIILAVALSNYNEEQSSKSYSYMQAQFG